MNSRFLFFLFSESLFTTQGSNAIKVYPSEKVLQPLWSAATLLEDIWKPLVNLFPSKGTNLSPLEAHPMSHHVFSFEDLLTKGTVMEERVKKMLGGNLKREPQERETKTDFPSEAIRWIFFRKSWVLTFSLRKNRICATTWEVVNVTS